jgi:guanine deaminase
MKFFILILSFLFLSLRLNAQTSQEDKEKFMQMAIDLAKLSSSDGENWPFGAVVVKDGVVVGKGFNTAHTSNDATAHGEINAIRDACKNLGTSWLAGCSIYTNGEPCPMCFGGCFFAHIDTIYYGATKEDMAAIGITDMNPYIQSCLPNEERNIKSEVILREESGNVFRDWIKLGKKEKY